MKERMGYISEKDDLSLRKQCELLSVNRSNLYYEPVPESEENLAMMRLMDEHYLNHRSHWVLQKMQDFLFLSGLLVNPKRVRRFLQLMGIMVIYPRHNIIKPGDAKYFDIYEINASSAIFIKRIETGLKTPPTKVRND